MRYRCGTVLFFFFKQKTAYEMRISDWSSDVCSSDLHAPDAIGLARIDAAAAIGDAADDRHAVAELVAFDRYRRLGDIALRPAGIGRARTVERIAGLRRHDELGEIGEDRKSTRLNSSH